MHKFIYGPKVLFHSSSPERHESGRNLENNILRYKSLLAEKEESLGPQIFILPI
jgi:hypothetical protein